MGHGFAMTRRYQMITCCVLTFWPMPLSRCALMLAAKIASAFFPSPKGQAGMERPALGPQMALAA